MRALIAGGGIGGATAAIALRRAGIDAIVFERATAATEVGAGISIWGNATRALASIGAAEPVLARGEPMQIGEMRTWRGRLQSVIQMGALDRRLAVRSVIIHRAELLDALLQQLPRDAVRFGHELVSCRNENGGVVASFRNGTSERGDLLIGADGIRSKVREEVAGPEAPRYSGYTCWRGVVSWQDFSSVPAGYVSETWGRGTRFGIVRMTEGRIYWFATKNAKPVPPSLVDADPKGELRSLFGGFWGPIPALIAATPEDQILRHDLFDRPPRRGWSKGRITLLGDAAHPTTPNIGQGGCLAIEDGIVLARCLESGQGVEAAFRDYESRRFDRCAEITRFSWNLGLVGQLANPLICELRDFFFRLTPERAIVKRHERYVGFDCGAAAASGRLIPDSGR